MTIEALTDEDTAMQAPAVSPQWRSVEELQRRGWRYVRRDASGRRVIMEREGDRCLVCESGEAYR